MDWTTCILVILTSIVAIHYFFLRKRGKLEELGILHARRLPIFGNIAAAIFGQRSFVDVVDRTYRINDAAKYIGFYDFGEPVIIIRSPELMKDITVKHFDHFVDHCGFTDPNVDPFFGNNLFSLRGKKWRNMRYVLTPAFTGRKMKFMFKLMSECSKNFADFFIERAINEPIVFEGKDTFMRYTTDVIATCLFGISVDSMRNPKNEFWLMGRKATDLEGGLSLRFFFLRSFRRLSNYLKLTLIGTKIENFFENLVKETVEMRDREGIVRPDPIQLMMESRDTELDDGFRLSILNMTSQLFSFYFGGAETTSSLICFAVYEMAINPVIQKKLQDDIDAVLEETDGRVTYEAICAMQYLDAVVNETLRIHPVLVILDRRCVKTYQLPSALPGGKSITVEPGQNIWFPIYSIQHDEKHFAKPEEYDPNRFLGAEKSNIDPFTFIPFGQGPRTCIGNRFAILETKVMLFHLLAKFYAKLSPKMHLPLELSTASFPMTAKGGFWLQLEPRDDTMKNIADTSDLASPKINGVHE